MAHAMVLAAGLGTRLRPLTDELPKPLVPVGDAPLVASVLRTLRAAGFSEIVLNTHHAASRFDAALPVLGRGVHLVHEPVIRGTAGGIAGARSLMSEGPVVVWNGDILASPPLSAIVAATVLHDLVFCVAPRARFEGTVGLDHQGDVVRLRGECFGEEERGGDYVGIAAIGQRLVRRLPEEGCLVGDVALPRLREGLRLPTVPLDGTFQDVGTVAAYWAANQAWAAPRGGVWVHPSAIVSPDVTLSAALIGAGASVEGRGTVERAIVWPGATVVAPLRDAVVTTEGQRVRIS